MCFSDIYGNYIQDSDPKRLSSHPFLKKKMAFNKKAQATRDGFCSQNKSSVCFRKRIIIIPKNF